MAVLLTMAMPLSTHAISAEQLDMFAQNNILFYDPGSGCIDGKIQYATGSVSYKNLSAEQVRFIETYHNIAVVNSINYGIPWETVMAQGILESAAGTSTFAITRNNFFGIGAFDSNPNNAYSYATPEEGWEGYYKNIQATPTYRNHGVFAGDTITNPYAYLVAIKAAGYATSPSYVENVSPIIAEIESYSKKNGWDSSLSLARKHPEWYTNAERNRQGAKPDATGDSTYRFCGGSGSLSSGGMGVSRVMGVIAEKFADERGLVWPETIAPYRYHLIGIGENGLAEAEKFMSGYRNEADKMAKGNLRYDGAFIHDSGCPSGTMNNCSAFVQWFLNRYTTLGGESQNKVPISQGSRAVSNYLSKFSSLTDGGKTPRVYAIVSMGPKTGKADGWSNHTGIVLGIDEANNRIIIGEASCGMSNGKRNYAPRAKAYSLKQYTNNSSSYGPTYAYTDNVLKGF